MEGEREIDFGRPYDAGWLERPKEILLVDDSRAQRRLWLSTLVRWGYRVTEAATGEAALALCRARHFDVILSDWMMPGMSGPEFCAAFRQLETQRYTYFILVTSRSDKIDIVRGLENGADDFLTKPVSTVELKARIRAGERILRMEEALHENNELLHRTLEELRALYDGIDRDLREARRLQQSLVPDRRRDYGAAEVAFLLEPSGHIGGDLVGSFRAGPDAVGLYAVDVSGHGVASALLTARIAALLAGSQPDRNVALEAGPDGAVRMRAPVEVCRRLNGMMLEEMATDLYFTMAIARLDLLTGQLDLAQAGHPCPVLHRACGRIEQLCEGGMPVGLLETPDFGECSVRLAPGDQLLFVSDGVTECSDAEGRQFEETGLVAYLAGQPPDGRPEYLDALRDHLLCYARDGELDDDMSGLLLAYRGDAARPA